MNFFNLFIFLKSITLIVKDISKYKRFNVLDLL